MKEVDVHLQKAQGRLSKLREEATAHRKEFLEELREAAIRRDDGTRAQAIKKIENAEASKRCFRKLKQVLQDSLSEPLTKVDVHNGEYSETRRDDGTITRQKIYNRVSDREPLEQCLIQRNIKHFSQSHTDGTPFKRNLVAPILNNFCFELDTEHMPQ
jgi:hypothetical protein